MEWRERCVSWTTSWYMVKHNKSTMKDSIRVLNKLQESGLTLNREKCTFSQKKVKFLGQILTPSGVRTDPDKVVAIHRMELTNVSDVRRFLGMANQLSKFIPNISKPLRDLLSKNSLWYWDQPQMEACQKIKQASDQKPCVVFV